MFIKDQEAANTVPEILEQLASLPSGFSGYIRKIIVLEPPLSTEEQEQHQQAQQLYDEACNLPISSSEKNDRDKKIELLLKAKKNIPNSRQD